MSRQINKHWVFYTKFGLELRSHKDDFLAQCPFCVSTDTFGIKQETGQYNCYKCGGGNHYTFIRQLTEIALASTPEAAYHELSANRSIMVSTLKQATLCRNPLNGNWLLPSRNETGEIMNLYQAVEQRDEETTETTIEGNSVGGQGNYPGQRISDNGHTVPLKRPPVAPVRSANNQHYNRASKYRIESAAEPCQQILYGLELAANQPTVILCEGHWDKLVLWEVFAFLAPIFSRNSACWDWDMQVLPEPDYHNPIFREILILGSPGSNQFQADWVKYVRNRNLILIYDNDKDRVICPQCRGTKGYKAHPIATPCPKCGGMQTTGQIINPGRDGIAKVLKELDQTGTPLNSLLHVRWLPSDPKDVRDLMKL